MYSGFIVNMQDSTTFEIDINFTKDRNSPDFPWKKATVRSYSYIPLRRHHFTHGCSIKDEQCLEGFSYKCRIRGLGVLRDDLQQLTRVNYLVKKLINEHDGQVRVNVHGIDQFDRLLVDVNLVSGKKCINLCEYLIKIAPDIFYLYPNRNT